jgi:hypothetical protein
MWPTAFCPFTCHHDWARISVIEDDLDVADLVNLDITI